MDRLRESPISFGSVHELEYNIMSSATSVHHTSIVGGDVKECPGVPYRRRQVFKSRRIPPAELGKQAKWNLSDVGKSSLRRAFWNFIFVVTLGLLAATTLLVTAYFEVPRHEYCLVLDEQFDGPELDTSTWGYDIELGGYGNGEFELTTNSKNNSFIEDGVLYIVPTLTADNLGEAAITNGYILNLTALGTCTSALATDCVAVSNSTIGNVSVIPPIQSARIHTRFSGKTLRYGRVEISAKMPTGDWIWPAIWMLPQNDTYGIWPKSGEIDIVETRGNKVTAQIDQNYNTVRTSLHWGSSPHTDRYEKTTAILRKFRKYYNKSFYTFGLEWDDKQISTWQGTRATEILAHKFTEPFWKYGKLSGTNNNTNPWGGATNQNIAPFDQDFYLILSLAVGGTNGYFPDGVANKPWGNKALAPQLDFWNARETWLPSWGTDLKTRALAIDYVKMWSIKEPGQECPA